MNAVRIDDNEVIVCAALWVQTLFPKPMAELNPETKLFQ
jgi:hypothetical protein